MRVNPSDINKILVVQFRPFGDVLLATSYLEALKNTFPWADIDFLVKQPYQEVLDKNPFLSEVISFSQKKGTSYILGRIKLMSQIRKQRYDLVIDQQNGTGSGQVLLLSGAKYRLGWIDGKWRFIYNLKGIKGRKRYRGSQNFDMLSPLGIKEVPYRFWYHIRPDAKAFVKQWLSKTGLKQNEMICISPGSPKNRKKWDIQNYTKLVEIILGHFPYPVVILWAPGELKDAQTIIAQNKNKIHLAPPTSFNQGAAFLEKSKLLICNDGGLNHLSVAVETPSLAIFGNTSPRVWSPEGVFPHHYHIHNPKWKRMSDNSFGITPEEVFNKVRTILDEI